MIRHTKHLVTLFLLIGFFSCSEGKVQQAKSQPTDSVRVHAIKSPSFVFYKSFAFCESEIGYFAQKEADSIYADKTLVVSKGSRKPLAIASLYSDSEWQCVQKNLDISDPVIIESVASNEPFPFDKLVLINNKYLLAARDGYFFVFTDLLNNDTKLKNDKTVSHVAFDPIFNKKLTGLSIVNEKEQSIFKKYGVDFTAECMCNTPSVYIDKEKNELILFNYCDGSRKFSEMQHKVVLKISSTKMEGGKLIFTTDQNIKFTFSRKEHQALFELNATGKLPTDYIGTELKRYFTPKPEQFYKVDCGDYQG